MPDTQINQKNRDLEYGPWPEQCTEVRFASFLSGGFITAIVNPPERKLEKNAPLCSGYGLWVNKVLINDNSKYRVLLHIK